MENKKNIQRFGEFKENLNSEPNENDIRRYVGSICDKCGEMSNHDEIDEDICVHCKTKFGTWKHIYEPVENLFPDSRIQKRIFIKGANWQAKKMYSEEEVLDLIDKYNRYVFSKESPFSDNITLPFKKWFEQFKKK